MVWIFFITIKKGMCKCNYNIYYATGNFSVLFKLVFIEYTMCQVLYLNYQDIPVNKAKNYFWSRFMRKDEILRKIKNTVLIYEC